MPRYLAQLPGDVVVRIQVGRELRVGSAVLVAGRGLFEVVAIRYVGDGETLEPEVVLAHWPSVTDAFVGQIAHVRAPLRSFDVVTPTPVEGFWKGLFRRFLGLFRS